MAIMWGMPGFFQAFSMSVDYIEEAKTLGPDVAKIFQKLFEFWDLGGNVAILAMLAILDTKHVNHNPTFMYFTFTRWTNQGQE